MGKKKFIKKGVPLEQALQQQQQQQQEQPVRQQPPEQAAAEPAPGPSGDQARPGPDDQFQTQGRKQKKQGGAHPQQQVRQQPSSEQAAAQPAPGSAGDQARPGPDDQFQTKGRKGEKQGRVHPQQQGQQEQGAPASRGPSTGVIPPQPGGAWGQQQQHAHPPQQQPHRPGPPQQQQHPGPPQQYQQQQPQQQRPGPPQQQQQQRPSPPQQQWPGPPQQQQQRPGPRGDAPQQQQQEQQQRPGSRGDAPQQQKQRQQRPGPPQPQSQPMQPPTKVEAITKGIAGLEMQVKRKKLLDPNRRRPGRRMLIETNHLALMLGNVQTAIHYDVALDPDRPKKLLTHVMEVFRLKHYPQRYPAFDGMKNLYSSSMLPFGQILSDEVEILEDDRPKKYQVTVKFASRVDMTALKKFFESSGVNRQHMETPREAIQCVDIVLRSAPNLTFIQVGRSFFTPPKNKILPLGDGMEMYYGFYQSAIVGWKPFLNVDVAHKAFPQAMRVIDLIMQLCRLREQDMREKLQPYNYEMVQKFIRNLKVSYEIPNQPGIKKVMRVNDLDRTAREAMFKPDGSSAPISVEAYFKHAKRYSLQFPNMPCLWVGSKTREDHMLFPAELCTVVGGQVTNRKMTETQTSNMIKQAATPADVRKAKIMEAMRTANFNSSPAVREFGFHVNDQFEQVDARVLDAPSLQYNEKALTRVTRGVWRAGRFREAQRVIAWGLLSLDYRTDENGLMMFAQEMKNTGGPLGMEFDKPSVSKVRLPNRPLDKQREIEREFAKLGALQLVVVVIPDNDKNIYNYVKQAAELQVGLLTQCVKARNVYMKKPATVGNILLKVNAKLNGINHLLSGPDRPPCMRQPCMVMGADVTHPAPDAQDIPSFAAVTASHDPGAFKYNLSWRLQPPKVEIIEDLENIFIEHLKFFRDSNRGTKPVHIVFFRDGVSEGQFEIVLNAEVQALRRACMRLQPNGDYKPKITFLVVQKRHHTRFFPTNSKDADRNGNVPAGTCVDTHITHPTALDFYLVSHASIQGTSRPTKYRVLWDDADMDEDEIEQLTYYLCHMFTRCTRSVSYPAPTYYAHLAAARSKVYCETTKLNMQNLQNEQQRFQIKTKILKENPMFFV